jgi:hypothetical protein
MAEYNAALRAELVQMQGQEQLTAMLLAQGLRAGDAHEEAKNHIRQLERNTARLKQIVAQHGWPGYELVESDGAQAAWLIAQHSEHDPVFQAQVVTLLEAAVRENQADMQHLAYLTDRVRLAQNLPQVYGTQFMGGTRLLPVEDPANLNARRAKIGFPPIADYMQQLEFMSNHMPPISQLIEVLQIALDELTLELSPEFVAGFAKVLNDKRQLAEQHLTKDEG